MGFWSDLKDAGNNIKEEKKALSSGTAAKLEYLGGHPKLVAGEMVVWKGETPNAIILQRTAGAVKHEITVTKLEWDEKGKRSAGKAAAGAIIGGVLTGGIGLLAGAAIGAKKKDNSVAILTCTIGVIESNIYFRADNTEYQRLASLLM